MIEGIGGSEEHDHLIFRAPEGDSIIGLTRIEGWCTGISEIETQPIVKPLMDQVNSYSWTPKVKSTIHPGMDQDDYWSCI
jgi:hypothetical protein